MYIFWGESWKYWQWAYWTTASCCWWCLSLQLQLLAQDTWICLLNKILCPFDLTLSTFDFDTKIGLWGSSGPPMPKARCCQSSLEYFLSVSIVFTALPGCFQKTKDIELCRNYLGNSWNNNNHKEHGYWGEERVRAWVK